MQSLLVGTGGVVLGIKSEKCMRIWKTVWVPRLSRGSLTLSPWFPWSLSAYITSQIGLVVILNHFSLLISQLKFFGSVFWERFSDCSCSATRQTGVVRGSLPDFLHFEARTTCARWVSFQFLHNFSAFIQVKRMKKKKNEKKEWKASFFSI